MAVLDQVPDLRRMTQALVGESDQAQIHKAMAEVIVLIRPPAELRPESPRHADGGAGEVQHAGGTPLGGQDLAVIEDDGVLTGVEVGMQIRQVVFPGVDIRPPPIMLAGMAWSAIERLTGKTRAVWSRKQAVKAVEEADALAAALKAEGRNASPDRAPESGFYYRSDHFSLAKLGVPMLYAEAGEDLIDGGTAAGASQTEQASREMAVKRTAKPLVWLPCALRAPAPLTFNVRLLIPCSQINLSEIQPLLANALNTGSSAEC